MKRQVLGVAIAILCGPALAANAAPSVYLSAQVGRTDFNVSNSDFPSLTVDTGSGVVTASPNVDSEGTAKIFLLGFRATPNLGFDAGYADLGELSVAYQPGGVARLTEQVRGFTVGGNLLLPAYRQLTVFSRAGLFRWKVDADGRVAGQGSASDSDNGTDLYLGAGFLFGWDNLKFRAGYTRYEVDDNHADVVSAGLQYFFPVR